MKRNYDVIVIGGGVVGLWTALQAARSGKSVALLERCERLGRMATRNSGALHGGIYYPPDSLKALHCVRGRRLAVTFLREQGVPFAICGKYIVPAATQEGEAPPQTLDAYAELEYLRDTALANGVEDVAIQRADQPFLLAEWTLRVGCTGIVDLPAYVEALERAVRQSGVEIFLNRTCVAGEAGRVWASEGTTATEEEFAALGIVNSAGLFADTVAEMFGLTGYEVRPNKGSYFQLRFPLPVQTLVYPLKSRDTGFLGYHYTPDMRGMAWVGPNSEWSDDKEDFTPTGDREAFYKGLTQVIKKDIYKPEDLVGPSKMGIRSRLFENGQSCSDFVIREHPAGVCHLLGIESPGLTSSPSLALDALARIGAL